MLEFDDDGADYSWYDASMELDFNLKNGIFACMFRRLWLNSDSWETLKEMMDDLGEEEINEFFDFDEIEFSKNTADFFPMDKLVWTKDELFDYFFPLCKMTEIDEFILKHLDGAIVKLEYSYSFIETCEDEEHSLYEERVEDKESNYGVIVNGMFSCPPYQEDLWDYNVETGDGLASYLDELHCEEVSESNSIYFFNIGEECYDIDDLVKVKLVEAIETLGVKYSVHLDSGMEAHIITGNISIWKNGRILYSDEVDINEDFIK